MGGLRAITRGSMGFGLQGLQASIEINEEQKKEWDKANLYYSLEFEDPAQADTAGFTTKKQPLIDQRKRRLLSHLLKNEGMVSKSVHNSLIEKIIYG